MTIFADGKAEMLNALSIGKMSLHTAYPGSAGANEVAGGSYAQQTCTFGAAAGSVRTLSAPVAFSVPACTVEWVGFLTAGGSMRACSPNGGSPKEFYVDPATDVFSSPSHGFAADDAVVFYADTVPGPLVEGTKYYVRDVTANSFKVAATAGGSAIDITSVGGSACVVSKIIADVYSGSGTHTINTATLGLPN